MKKITISDIIKLGIEGGLFLTLSYFIWMKFYSVIMYPYPHEFREMNMVAVAKRFSQGINPYSYQSLEFNEIPEVTNLYGFLAPLLISPLIRIFGGRYGALQICQIMTLIVEVIGNVLFYACTYHRTKDRLVSLLGTVIFYSCYWRYTPCGGAFPDQWGMTLSLVLTYVFILDDEKGKYHSTLYVFLLLCMFYIKQYFVFAALGIFVALLIRSKKMAGGFVFWGIVLGAVSVIMVQILMPLYFAESIPLMQGATSSNDIHYSLNQILVLGFEKYAVFTYMLVLAVITWGALNMTDGETVADLVKKGVKRLPYEMIQLIVISIPTIYIAQNRGTYLTYYLQIWLPYLIMTGCIAARYLYKNMFVHKSRLIVPLLFLAAVISYGTIKPVVPFLKSKFLTAEEVESWETAYSLLEQYSKEGEILVSPHLSAYCMEQEIRTADYGQAEFNNTGNMEMFESDPLWTKLFPYTKTIIEKSIGYHAAIKKKIENNGYTCIALTSMGRYWLDEKTILEAGYQLKCEMTLVTGTQGWVTRFYVIH